VRKWWKGLSKRTRNTLKGAAGVGAVGAGAYALHGYHTGALRAKEQEHNKALQATGQKYNTALKATDQEHEKALQAKKKEQDIMAGQYEAELKDANYLNSLVFMNSDLSNLRSTLILQGRLTEAKINSLTTNLKNTKKINSNLTRQLKVMGAQMKKKKICTK
jgi:hypothetical protein